MYLRIWDKKKGDVRVYINGHKLGKFKAWFSKGSAGNVVLNVPDSVEFDVKVELDGLARNYLLEEGLIDAKDGLIDWGRLVDLSKDKAEEYQKPSKKSQRQASRLRKKAETKAGAEHSVGNGREIESLELDLTSVSLQEAVFITVDHRESPEMIELLSEHPKISVGVDELVFGDIVVSGRNGQKVVFERIDCSERSNGNELSDAVRSSKVFSESTQMKIEENVTPFYLLEGDAYQSSAMSLKEVDEIVSYLAAVQGVNVLNTVGLNHSAYLVVKIAQRFNFGLDELPEQRPGKPELIEDAKPFVLEGIPGVTPGIAKNLLQHFGTIQALSCASIGEIIAVEGVGPQQALPIYNVFH